MQYVVCLGAWMADTVNAFPFATDLQSSRMGLRLDGYSPVLILNLKLV